LETKRGLSAAQNTGWRLASGEIIAFTDDDCYVQENFIDALVEAFEEDTRIGFIGGRILLYDPRDLPMTVLTSENRHFFPPHQFIGAGQVMGANLAFRREALQRIGGMNELLGAGTRFGSNDVEAAASALWAGFAGAYDPRPTVYHHHGRQTDEAIKDLWLQYDEGRGAYYAEFLRKKESRWIYAKELAQLWWPDLRVLIGALRRGRLPKLTRLMREVRGGAAYIALHRRKSPRVPSRQNRSARKPQNVAT
jgi:GT2 family glycosyltransferase